MNTDHVRIQAPDEKIKILCVNCSKTVYLESGVKAQTAVYMLKGFVAEHRACEFKVPEIKTVKDK